MAQLVKLYDYVSRYESNPFHYPTQFIRLKQENWQQLEDVWRKEQEEVAMNRAPIEKEEIKKQRLFDFFSKKGDDSFPDDTFPSPSLPSSKKELVQYFLDQLLPFQYKWATSTISHVSYTDSKYMSDDMLTYFLQRFPDIYLLMYYPIFSIKNAPVDGEIIMISPVSIEIIYVVQGIQNASIIVSENRSWTVETSSQPTSMLSPVISLRRTEQIIQSILQVHHIDFPIQKVILSEENDFLYHTEPYQTKVIGKNQYKEWFLNKRKLQSPLKSIQLKVMEALLHHCHSTSVRRPEWKQNDDLYPTIDSLKDK